MSYCRFSSMNFMCQLYCYADVGGGYTTHVAGNKVVGLEALKEVPLTDETITDGSYMLAHKALMAFINAAEHKPIGLPYDGESFNDATLEEFRDRLLMLRATGYIFPGYVLDAVEAEIAEGDSEEQRPVD